MLNCALVCSVGEFRMFKIVSSGFGVMLGTVCEVVLKFHYIVSLWR